jgi:hypothetical protein
MTSSEGGPDEMNFVVGSNEKGKKNLTTVDSETTNYLGKMKL